MNNNYNYIDIFAGCGGLSLGLYLSGWKGLFAIEKDDMAFETLKHNLIDNEKHFDWPDWLPKKHYDINRVMRKYKKELLNLKGKVDLIAGGPPCQGFSSAGKRVETDKRNKLIHSYIKFVNLVQPQIILFENVKGFTQNFKKNKSKGLSYSKIVLEELRKIGYTNIRAEMVDFSEFGVPQKRERFIIIGTRQDSTINFFDLLNNRKDSFLAKKGMQRPAKIKSAISDLRKSSGTTQCPDTASYRSGTYSPPTSNYQRLMRSHTPPSDIPNSHRFAKQSLRIVNVYKRLHNYALSNDVISDKIKKRFGVKKRNITLLGKNNFSPTLMSIPDDFVHYCEPRILTVREYARLQSFPDWYEFRGKYTTGGKRRAKEVPRYTQVANAIPPLFAEHAGNILMELID